MRGAWVTARQWFHDPVGSPDLRAFLAFRRFFALKMGMALVGEYWSGSKAAAAGDRRGRSARRRCRRDGACGARRALRVRPGTHREDTALHHQPLLSRAVAPRHPRARRAHRRACGHRRHQAHDGRHLVLCRSPKGRPQRVPHGRDVHPLRALRRRWPTRPVAALAGPARRRAPRAGAAFGELDGEHRRLDARHGADAAGSTAAVVAGELLLPALLVPHRTRAPAAAGLLGLQATLIAVTAEMDIAITSAAGLLLFFPAEAPRVYPYLFGATLLAYSGLLG